MRTIIVCVCVCVCVCVRVCVYVRVLMCGWWVREGVISGMLACGVTFECVSLT